MTGNAHTGHTAPSGEDCAPAADCLEIVARIRHFKGLLADADGSVIGTQRNRLVRYAPPYARPETLATLPGSWQRTAGRLRLVHRLLRLEIYRMTRTPAGTLIATSREGILRCEPSANNVDITFSRFQGRRPISLCCDAQGRIYFGEYFSNEQRGPVDVFMSEDDGRNWQECYRFAAGEIRHVHGLVYDRFRDKIWVMTGDYENEARIAIASPRFAEVLIVAQGSQMTRACDGVCTPQGIVYATDTPLAQNHVFQLDAETGASKSVAQIQNSVLLMGQACGGLWLSTIVEPSEVNRTQAVHVWYSADGSDWQEVLRAQRDRWSIRYFQYPTASFAAGPIDAPVAFVSLRGVRKHDGDCLVVRPRLPASTKSAARM